jgi:lipid A 3-O-deacylase
LGFSQKRGQLSTFKLPSIEKFVRFSYDIDLFAATDQNYTHGYSFGFAVPMFSKNPVNNIFFKTPNSSSIFGLAFEHIVYTPYDYCLLPKKAKDRQQMT